MATARRRGKALKFSTRPRIFPGRPCRLRAPLRATRGRGRVAGGVLGGAAAAYGTASGGAAASGGGPPGAPRTGGGGQGPRPPPRFPSGDFLLSHRPISFKDLRHATSQVGDFGADNRAGISWTLHRISAIRNRKAVIVGLTCRVGRAVPASPNLLQDLVKDGGSLLLIGPPGVGKTTVVREIARILADDYKKRVMIVDTSNEIGSSPRKAMPVGCKYLTKKCSIRY